MMGVLFGGLLKLVLAESAASGYKSTVCLIQVVRCSLDWTVTVTGVTSKGGDRIKCVQSQQVEISHIHLLTSAASPGSRVKHNKGFSIKACVLLLFVKFLFLRHILFPILNYA